MLPQVVEATPLAPPRTGLLATLTALGMADERWAGGGIEWEPEACGLSGAYDPDVCSGSPLSALDIPDGPEVRNAKPFVAWAGDKCSPWQDRDWRGKARRQLDATLSFQVAQELWTGTLAQAAGWDNPFLASPAADELTTSAATPTEALACLEQGIASYAKGRRGMIHAMPALVTQWHAGGALRREGGLILTIHDTIVVADSGYDGSSPAGVAASAGHVWAYGTELVQVRLGAVRFVPDADVPGSASLRRDVNTVEVRAERPALATWDGCVHVAVEVNVPICTFGGA